MCTLNNNIETHIHKNVLGQIHGQIREIHPLRWRWVLFENKSFISNNNQKLSLTSLHGYL